jgi:hypothetical protein
MQEPGSDATEVLANKRAVRFLAQTNYGNCANPKHVNRSLPMATFHLWQHSTFLIDWGRFALISQPTLLYLTARFTLQLGG